jgi:hypothetical protein
MVVTMKSELVAVVVAYDCKDCQQQRGWNIHHQDIRMRFHRTAKRSFLSTTNSGARAVDEEVVVEILTHHPSRLDSESSGSWAESWTHTIQIASLR